VLYVHVELLFFPRENAQELREKEVESRKIAKEKEELEVNFISL
jgi:hypothetical protein